MNLARVDEILARHDAVPAWLNAVPGQPKKHEGGELSSIEGAPTGYDSRLDAVLSGVRRFEQRLTLADVAYIAGRLDAEWDEQAHPRKATGQFAPKGQGGAPSPPTGKTAQIKMKYLQQLEAWANAGEWGKVENFSLPAGMSVITSSAKVLANYKKQLLKHHEKEKHEAPAEEKQAQKEMEENQGLKVPVLYKETLEKLGYNKSGSLGGAAVYNFGETDVMVTPNPAGIGNATWKILGSSGVKAEGTGFWTLEDKLKELEESSGTKGISGSVSEVTPGAVLPKEAPANMAGMEAKITGSGLGYEHEIGLTGAAKYKDPDGNLITITAGYSGNWMITGPGGFKQGNGVESLNAAFEALHPRDASGHFIKKPGEMAAVPAKTEPISDIYGSLLSGASGFTKQGTAWSGDVLYSKGSVNVIVSPPSEPSSSVSKWKIVQTGKENVEGVGYTKLSHALAEVQTPAAKPAVSPPLDFSTMEKIGPMLGTTPGGRYKDAAGKEFYVKQSETDRSKNEILAAALFSAVGGNTFKYHEVKSGNDTYVGTDWEQVDKDNVDQFSAVERAEMQKDFALHAWLANWDVGGAGPEHPGANMGIVGGKVTPLDLGGALLYRGIGKPKGAAFGTDVTEWDLLRDPAKNPSAAKLFGDMTETQLRLSAERLKSVTDGQIATLVDQYGPGEADAKIALTTKLRERKKAILAKVAAPSEPSKPKYNLTGSEISNSKYHEDFIPQAPKPTPAERSAIEAYTDGQYEDINKPLRSGMPLPEYHHAIVKAVRAYLNKAKLPEDVVVTRRVSSKYAAKLRKSMKKGTIFADHGFVSTDHWSGDLTMKIHAPKGSKGAAVGKNSSHPGENEILFQAGTRFRVMAYTPGANYVELELIPEDHPDYI